MGIFGALTTAVGGLRAQSFALENVSGNIANSQTTASSASTPASRISIPQTATDRAARRRRAHAIALHQQVQGDVQTASVATYMAINGNGFFTVQKPGGFTDNVPVFDGVTATRAAAISSSTSGYLVNGAGYYLKGVPIDPTTGNPSGSVPQVLQIPERLPAGAGDHQDRLSRQPRDLSADHKHDTAVPRIGIARAGDRTPPVYNPLVFGTPASALHRCTTSGTRSNNKATPSGPTPARPCCRAPPASDLIAANFAVGDTITVNGTPVTFVAAGAVGNQLNITDSITTLLAKIDSITGTANPSTIAGGSITLHSGTTSNLRSRARTPRPSPRSASPAL